LEDEELSADYTDYTENKNSHKKAQEAQNKKPKRWEEIFKKNNSCSSSNDARSLFPFAFCAFVPFRG